MTFYCPDLKSFFLKGLPAELPDRWTQRERGQERERKREENDFMVVVVH